MKIEGDKFDWDIKPMETKPGVAEHLRRKGFDGVCYQATREAQSGRKRTFHQLVYRIAATGEYIFAIR